MRENERKLIDLSKSDTGAHPITPHGHGVKRFERSEAIERLERFELTKRSNGH